MSNKPKLELRFHGRVIDHLGIQMYQSPVAALAELVANAWDADAQTVRIELPTVLGANATIVVADDGQGMTLAECQERFLNVGYNRRGSNLDERSEKLNRPVLGRKGIGKFAGFGIAQVIEIDTVAESTGERTRFALDIGELRGNGTEYVSNAAREIEVMEYDPPSLERRGEHGTTVILRNLELRQRPSEAVFRRSMARRFLLHERTADFRVFVNDQPLPAAGEERLVEFDFPKDYTETEAPEEMQLVDEWGLETLSDGRPIRWRIIFYQETIDEDDPAGVAGVAVFVRGKLAQAPFFFQLEGGLGSQQAQPYLSGRVEADYLDEQLDDLIATERQRINWEHPAAASLLSWGQQRVQRLMRLWQERRSEAKMAILEQKLEPFAERLARLSRHEQRTVGRALQNLARVPKLSTDQFVDLGTAVVTAYENGRLRDLIGEVAEAPSLDEGRLVGLLLEANVLTALQSAESTVTQLLVVEGLRQRIEARALENRLRDFIADNPWLIGPQWQTFAREIRVTHLLRRAAQRAALDSDPDWKGRVDLALSAADTLLVVEFMRPGIRVDRDHVDRFDRYCDELETELRGNTALQLRRVAGFLVADNLGDSPALLARLERLTAQGRYAKDWRTLLREAALQYRHFLQVLANRAPDDRLQGLLDFLGDDIEK